MACTRGLSLEYTPFSTTRTTDKLTTITPTTITPTTTISTITPTTTIPTATANTATANTATTTTTTKVELLVLGGTWSEYPHSYQRSFLRDIYWSANTFFDELPKRAKEPLAEEQRRWVPWGTRNAL